MKNKMIKLLASALFNTFLLGNLATSNMAHASSYHELHDAVTKIAGNKNYAIYHNITSDGPVGKFANTKDFKYNHLESKKFIETKHGTYWMLIVNGRVIGWVNQNFFARNALVTANHVSLVENPYGKFDTKDAINYATTKTGTLKDPNSVKISTRYVKATKVGKHVVTFYNGKTTKKLVINVRKDANEGIAHANIEPTNSYQDDSSWHGRSKGSSQMWNATHHYGIENSKNNYKSSTDDMMFTTRLYQPRFLSLDYHMNDKLSQVGVTPEGIAINNGLMAVSLYADTHSLNGHLVTYNLNKLTNPYDAQKLVSMPWHEFVKYSHNIKVSPYLKLGHGQAISMTKDFIYVLANNNKLKNSANSEEIFQISRKDLTIKRIWTIKTWNNDANSPRYFHNAVFTNDNTMYGLFHNVTKGRYEYWRLTRHGNTWTPKEIGATDTNFVTNSPVQGFAYDVNDDKFYIGFNDRLFGVNADGQVANNYKFDTKRELEGLSIDQGMLYAELAQRSELLQTNISKSELIPDASNLINNK